MQDFLPKCITDGRSNGNHNNNWTKVFANYSYITINADKFLHETYMNKAG